MKPKNVLLLSVLAGLLAVFLVWVQIQREQGKAVTIFRATATVEPGQALGQRIEEVTLPGDELFPNILKEAPTEEMREYVASTPLRERVHEGQVILYRHLEASADPGLRSQIPAGMKAIAIEVDASQAVGYLVEPEDHVDVLAAMPVKSDDGELARLRSRFARETGLDADLLDDLVGPGMGGALETQVLVEDAEILAVGRRYRRAEPGEPPERYGTVTLLVDRREAERLAHAREIVGSAMTLVLRSPEDDEPEDEGVREASG